LPFLNARKEVSQRSKSCPHQPVACGSFPSLFWPTSRAAERAPQSGTQLHPAHSLGLILREVAMWFFELNKYPKLAEEIDKQRDRGAAILAASVLEDHLTEVIKTRMERNVKIESKMFKGYGPLASFAAKIDLGFLIGLYSLSVHKQLNYIREIRNEFAHNLEPLSFRSQRIKDLCAHLQHPRGATRFFQQLLDQMSKTAKESYVVNPDGTERKVPFVRMIPKASPFERSSNPRTQYMRGVQAILFELFLQRFDHLAPDWTKTENTAPRPRIAQ
jgi:hypothetical protein